MKRTPFALWGKLPAFLTGPLVPRPDEKAKNLVEFFDADFHSLTKKAPGHRNDPASLGRPQVGRGQTCWGDAHSSGFHPAPVQTCPGPQSRRASLTDVILRSSRNTQGRETCLERCGCHGPAPCRLQLGHNPSHRKGKSRWQGRGVHVGGSSMGVQWVALSCRPRASTSHVSIQTAPLSPFL